MDFDTIEAAFLFVSSGPPFEHTAVVHRITGESYYASEMAGLDELPEDVDENDDYIDIPHKSDLNLGKPLVMEFAREHCPDRTDEVFAIFQSSGAYGRFKDLLEEMNLLESWYLFEEQRTREALLQWCEENGIVLD